MGKFNKNLDHDRANSLRSEEINWEQFFGDGQHRNIEEKTKDLMNKVKKHHPIRFEIKLNFFFKYLKFITRQGIEFDQVCIVLKHLLIQNKHVENGTTNGSSTNDASKTSFLDYFLTYDNQTYVNVLVEKFDASPELPNVQWMISEIFK